MPIEDFSIVPPISNSLIKSSREVIPQAVEELRRLESKEELPFITRYEHFNVNTAGGAQSKNIFIISGTSGTGKSLSLQTLEEDFLNSELNPEAKDHILLRCNWEMVARSILMRAIRQKTDMTIKDIYYKIKSQQEKEWIDKIIDRELSDNIFYMPDSVTPEVFKREIKAFCAAHSKAKKIMVSIDHIGLTVGGDKFVTMNNMIEVLNDLKKDPVCDKLILFGVMQLNRKIEERSDFRHLAPLRSDLYGADMVYQTADFVIILNRPAKNFHDKYMEVNPKNYPHLTTHMFKPEAIKTSFKTQGLMFWHYIKIRDEDNTMSNIAIEKLSEKAVQQIESQAMKTTMVEKFSKGEEGEDLPF